MILGYAAWLAVLISYGSPRMREMAPEAIHRAIAALHSFRFFGLVCIVPGVVGPDLPKTFASFAAYGDFATALLAMAALIAFPLRRAFWTFVVAFNFCGVCDLAVNYYHAVEFRLPEVAGQLGAAYLVPIIYVPLLMMTHVLAFLLLLRGLPRRAS
ncbi:MAG: hypothetical protein ACTHKR_09540 [Sphingomonas sp.]